MFDRNLAQRWWIENYDRIMELFNVQSFNGQAANPPALSDSEDEVIIYKLTFALINIMLFNTPSSDPVYIY